MLAPVTPDSYQALYTLATHEAAQWTWRYRGNPPPFESFVGDLASNTVQHLVVRRADGSLAGHVAAYDWNPQSQYAYLSVLIAPDYARAGWPLEGVVLFLRQLLAILPLRKVYLEFPARNEAVLGQGVYSQVFHLEGRLRDHNRIAGGYEDSVIYAAYTTELGPLLSDELPGVALPVEARTSDFRQAFVAVTGREVGTCPDWDRQLLVEDLGLDSLDLLTICEWFDALVPEGFPDDAVAALCTVGDVEHYWRVLTERAASSPDRAECCAEDPAGKRSAGFRTV